MTSQFEEDRVLSDLLDEIGDGSKIVADIGARLEFSNSANLIESRGYYAVLVDMDPAACEQLRRLFPEQKVIQQKATIDNVNDFVPADAHVVSIDVDSYDWWLWAVLEAKPKVVVIEVNSDTGYWVAPYHHNRKDPRGWGASVEAMNLLARLKGYRFHYRTMANAIYVHE